MTASGASPSPRPRSGRAGPGGRTTSRRPPRPGPEPVMPARPRAPAPRNVLFVGNSFTARNDLPGLIAALAAARGKTFRHHLVQAGGASLRTHWNAGHAARLIEGGGFDAVVLQEQSTLPVKNAARMHENVRLFDGAIRAAGAATALYMTWARRDNPESQAA